MGINVTPVVGSGTTHKKEASEYINSGNKTGRRMRRDGTAGKWMMVERKGIMLHRGMWGIMYNECGKEGRKNDTGDGWGVLQTAGV
jgi:hypothetical protein